MPCHFFRRGRLVAIVGTYLYALASLLWTVLSELDPPAFWVSFAQVAYFKCVSVFLMMDELLEVEATTRGIFASYAAAAAALLCLQASGTGRVEHERVSLAALALAAAFTPA